MVITKFSNTFFQTENLNSGSNQQIFHFMHVNIQRYNMHVNIQRYNFFGSANIKSQGCREYFKTDENGTLKATEHDIYENITGSV
jgi:hypothetical protein